MSLFEDLKERGLIYQTTDEEKIKKGIDNGKFTFYLGYDPTATDIHIGHLFNLRIFRKLQDAGNKGIFLVGGATGQVGDPSGKDEIRKLNSKKATQEFMAGIKKNVAKFIDISKVTFVDNNDWISKKSYIEFLREVGIHFNIAKMIRAQAYEQRMKEGGLTFLEMGYMLMQAYDFVHLNNTYGCSLQIGGSDQWGNMVAGITLNRKLNNLDEDKKSDKDIFVMTWPLLTTSDGKKMGKTEKGVLWLNKERTSVYDFYQYFYNVEDGSVEKLLLAFCDDLNVAQIKALVKKDIIEAKRYMAHNITALVHGKAEADLVVSTSQKLFDANQAGDDAPTENITLPKNADIIDLLEKTSIIKSRREAREMVEAGAILLDGEKVNSITQKIPSTKKQFLIKKGKKTFINVLVKYE